MRQRRSSLAGSAVAVALLAGALFGGVLARVSLRRIDGRRVAHRRSRRARSPGSPRAVRRPRSRGSRRRSRSAPSDPDALASLGLAYQVRWRETGDAVVPAALRTRRSRRRSPRAAHDPAATLGLGNLALIRHEFRDALVVGRKAQRARAVLGAALRRRSATPRSSSAATTTAFASFERMVVAEAESGLVCADRLRPRAERRHGRRDRGDAARARRCRRAARGDRLDAGRARRSSSSAAAASLPPSDAFRAALAVVPGYVYALEQRARVEAARGRLARGGRGSPGGPRRRSRCRSSSAFSATCSSGRAVTPRRGASSATVAAIDRLLVAERRPGRSRVGRLPRRPRIRPARDGCARAASARRSSLDLRRRRARLGARARRPLRGGRDAGRSARCGSGRGMRCSGSTAATPRGAPETRPGMKAWYAKALALNPQLLGAVRAPGAGGRVVKRLALLARTGGRPRRRGTARARRRVARTRSGTSPSTTSRTSSWRETRSTSGYALDLAEIPAFQEGAAVRRAGLRGERWRSELELRIDGRARAADRRRAPDVASAQAQEASRRCASTRSTARRRQARGCPSRTRHMRAGSAGARSSSTARDGARRHGELGAARRADPTSCARTRRTCCGHRSMCAARRPTSRPAPPERRRR